MDTKSIGDIDGDFTDENVMITKDDDVSQTNPPKAEDSTHVTEEEPTEDTQLDVGQQHASIEHKRNLDRHLHSDDHLDRNEEGTATEFLSSSPSSPSSLSSPVTAGHNNNVPTNETIEETNAANEDGYGISAITASASHPIVPHFEYTVQLDPSEIKTFSEQLVSCVNIDGTTSLQIASLAPLHPRLRLSVYCGSRIVSLTAMIFKSGMFASSKVIGVVNHPTSKAEVLSLHTISDATFIEIALWSNTIPTVESVPFFVPNNFSMVCMSGKCRAKMKPLNRHHCRLELW